MRVLANKMSIVIKLFLALVLYSIIQYLFSFTRVCKSLTSIPIGEQSYIQSCLTQQQTIFLIAGLICFIFAFLPKELLKDHESKIVAQPA